MGQIKNIKLHIVTDIKKKKFLKFPSSIMTNQRNSKHNYDNNNNNNNTNDMHPRVCFEVEKIIGISVGEGNLKNYHVIWAPTWISGYNLQGCQHLIDQFLQQQ